jgi:hypothetical protein
MNRIRSQLFELSGYILLVFLFLLFNFYLASQLSYTTGELVIETDQPGNFQVYWRKDNKPYKEKKSVIFKTHPDQLNYSFEIASFATFDWLRIDPVNSENHIRIGKLSFHHKIFPSINLFPRNKEIKLARITQLQVIEQDDVEGIQLISTGSDPHFEINVLSLLMSVIMPYLFLFVFFNFVGAILIYLILNQTLLKGKQSTATVVMAIPDTVTDSSKEQLIEINTKFCPGSRLVSVHRRPGSDKYVFTFPGIANSTLAPFLQEVKKTSQLIQYRVHYNRSGEV